MAKKVQVTLTANEASDCKSGRQNAWRYKIV